MVYNLFLFDLDDTLLDFRASERLSFAHAMESLNVYNTPTDMFARYQHENELLWKALENGETTVEQIKIERFRRTFDAHGIEVDPALASTRYLDALSQTVVLMDHAVEICEWLSAHGEIGVITNGYHHVQTRRIASSPIAGHISFIGVSDACGYSKPDVRFFEHTTAMAKAFSKDSTIIIGDRLEADILGAQNFGIDSCWFNHHSRAREAHIVPTHEIEHLSQLRSVLEKRG